MKPPCYINAYVIHRRYGGPEEGGWWYSEGFPLAYVDASGMDDDIADKIFETIDDAYKKQYTQDTDTRTETFVQKHRPKHFPTYRPQYE